MATRNKVTEEPARTAPEESLHTKYRPKRLEDVAGQSAIVKSIRDALKAKSRPHAFLFTGPSGTGKTTLGRILAAEVGVPAGGIIEVDAATKSGVDDVRALTESMRYSGFGDSPNRAVIVNECQRLSAGAWDAFLTSVEEPSAHAYYIFTSTHPAKIPKAMVTRCLTYELSPLPFDDLMDVLEEVCDAEGLKTPDDVLQAVARKCDGSMRAALTMLAKVQSMTDLNQVADALREPLEDKEIIELARLLVKRDLTWKRLTDTLRDIGENLQPEGARIVINHYIASCLMGAKSDRDARELWFMLDAFQKPFDPTTGKAPLLHAFGELMLRNA